MPNQLARSAGNFLDNNQALADSFSLELRNGRRPGTVITYLRAMERLGRFTSDRGMPPIAALTTEHLREYFASLWDRGLQASSISVDFRGLQQLFKFLVSEGERPDNPLQRIKAPQIPEKIQAHYGQAELETVLKKLPGLSKDWRVLRDRAIILTLLDTGLRGAELCGVKREDVNLRELSLRVKRAKGDRERDVFMSAMTAQALDRYLRQRRDLSPWLFISRGGGALTTNATRMMLERAWKQVGLDFKGVHGFRRGFAISFLDNGGDPEDLRTLAGWESHAMLRRYTRATETERARKAHSRFSPVASLNLGR